MKVHVMLFLLMGQILIQSSVYARYDIEVKSLTTLSANQELERIAFIDLSDRKEIAIHEIDLKGITTNFVLIPEEVLSRGDKNFRWGAALAYDPSDETYIVGFWKTGIFKISRKGEILARYGHPNVTHSIEIRPDGNMLFPFSWSSKSENQITEIDRFGNVVWSWSAEPYINQERPAMTINHDEPASYVAATGAAYLDAETVVVTLSQANRIVFIDKKTHQVIRDIEVTRPHVPVVKDGTLIGFSARDPNRIHLWDEACRCYKTINIEDLDAYDRKGRKGWARTLSLQLLSNGNWFVSGITSLREITPDGDELWRASIRPRPQWSGFHKVIRYQLR